MKANIFILMCQYQSAIAEFKSLLQIIPNEWKIHFHLGEVYLLIANKDKALLSFNRAMALNPKDKNTIKHAIQNVYAENGGADESNNIYRGGNGNEEEQVDDERRRGMRRQRMRPRRAMNDNDDDDKTDRES